MSDDDTTEPQLMELHLIAPVPDEKGKPIRVFYSTKAEWAETNPLMMEVRQKRTSGRYDVFLIPKSNIRCIRIPNADLGALVEQAAERQEAQQRRIVVPGSLQ